jgi:hypothetical protein
MLMVDPDRKWSEYQLMVLDKLDRLELVQEKVEVRLRSIETELALLKLKSSLWGGLAGVAAYAVTMGVQYISKR